VQLASAGGLHVLEHVEVTRAVVHELVGEVILAAGEAGAEPEDEHGIDAAPRPVRALCAIKIEPDIVDFGRGGPLDKHRLIKPRRGKRNDLGIRRAAPVEAAVGGAVVELRTASIQVVVPRYMTGKSDPLVVLGKASRVTVRVHPAGGAVAVERDATAQALARTGL
jgi:hypothetical protein